MTTRSIFQKVCPGCMLTVPSDSQKCSCGHLFDHDESNSELSSEEIRLKAEELYQNYLAARVEQAADAILTAQAEFACEPSSVEKSNRVSRAIHESQLAEAALTEQSTQVAELIKILRPSTPASESKRPRTATKKRPMRRVRAVVSALLTSQSQPTFTAVSEVAVQPKQTLPLNAQSAGESTPSTVSPIPVKSVTSQAVQRETPNQAFRQAQAAKVEKLLQKKTRPQVKSKAVTVQRDIVSEATSKPNKPIPTRHAPQLITADRKDCPNCTAKVSNHTSRCRCGYEFPSSEQLIPSLTMSEDERAELAKLFISP